MHIFKKQKLKMILAWTAVLFWLIFIFSLSAQPATQSDGLSKKVTKIIIEKVGRLVPLDVESDTTVDLVSKFNHIVRKFAHFFAYLVLGILMMNALRQSGIRGFKAFAFCITFCILYAASDELHQLFVSGRGAQVKDVLIDSAGSIVGIGMYAVATKINGTKIIKDNTKWTS